MNSYDVVCKDIDYLSQQFWNYCILDEGHIIKNLKSKITGVVKQLKAQHRLILSGTPIQVGHFYMSNSSVVQGYIVDLINVLTSCISE